MELGLPLRPVTAQSGRTAAGVRPVKHWASWVLPSFSDLLFLICLLAVVRIGGTAISGDADTVRHLTVGQALLRSGSFPSEDAFVYTKAADQMPPNEWLSKVAIAASYRFAGLAGPVLLAGTVVGVAFAILFQHLRSRGHPALLALAVTLLAAAATSIHWLARPHVVSFAAAAAFGALLDGWYAGRLSRRWLLALPLGMVFWVNAHGGFLVGLILIGTYVAADVLRWLASDVATAATARLRLASLLPVAAISLAATLLNPAGLAVYADVRDYLTSKLVLDFTQEYRSPDFHSAGPRFFLAMLLITLAALVWSRRRPALHEGVLLLGFTYMALFSARNIAIFAIATAPMLAAELAALPHAVSAGGAVGRMLAGVGTWLSRRNRVYAALDARATGHLWPMLALIGLSWLANAQWRAGQAPLGVQFNPALQPVAAVAYLQDHLPPGNGFNEQRWGGYVLYRLWPSERVFIDGELTARHQALMRDYLDVIGLNNGWQGVLNRYHVQWVLYSTDSPLVRTLAADPGWRVAYQDSVATVLTRESAR